MGSIAVLIVVSIAVFVMLSAVWSWFCRGCALVMGFDRGFVSVLCWVCVFLRGPKECGCCFVRTDIIFHLELSDRKTDHFRFCIESNFGANSNSIISIASHCTDELHGCVARKSVQRNTKGSCCVARRNERVALHVLRCTCCVARTNAAQR